MSHFTYTLILIFSILVPAVFTFEPNFKFYKKLPQLLISISISAFIFIIWDLIFTDAGIWGFNESYLLGVEIFNLPIEEMLFFIVIPYSCIFLYDAFYYHFNFDPIKPFSRFISIYLILFTNIIAWTNTDKSYTFSAMLFLSIVIFLAEFVFKNKEMSKFYFVFLIILIPFAVVNGILTGSLIEEPVVWYNDNANLGIRLGTIPFEDMFYGMSLILLDFCIFKNLTKDTIES